MKRPDLPRLVGATMVAALLTLVIAQFLGVGGSLSNARLRIILQFAAILLFGREAAGLLGGTAGGGRAPAETDTTSDQNRSSDTTSLDTHRQSERASTTTTEGEHGRD